MICVSETTNLRIRGSRLYITRCLLWQCYGLWCWSVCKLEVLSPSTNRVGAPYRELSSVDCNSEPVGPVWLLLVDGDVVDHQAESRAASSVRVNT